jgi:hypothetical protein
VTLVYERDGRETKFQRCISSQGTGEYRIDSKLVSYDTYASRLQDLGVLASAHTGFLVFQGYVSELANKSPSELTVGSHTSASRRTAASTSPERGTNHMHPVRRHCQALFEKISGSEELKAEDERLAKEKKAAEDDQQYNFNKKRALGQERNNMKARRPRRPRSSSAAASLAAAAASLSPITVRFCTTRRAEAKGRGREVLGPAREGRRAQTAALLIAPFRHRSGSDVSARGADGSTRGARNRHRPPERRRGGGQGE